MAKIEIEFKAVGKINQKALKNFTKNTTTLQHSMLRAQEAVQSLEKAITLFKETTFDIEVEIEEQPKKLTLWEKAKRKFRKK